MYKSKFGFTAAANPMRQLKVAPPNWLGQIIAHLTLPAAGNNIWTPCILILDASREAVKFATWTPKFAP